MAMGSLAGRVGLLHRPCMTALTLLRLRCPRPNKTFQTRGCFWLQPSPDSFLSSNTLANCCSSIFIFLPLIRSRCRLVEK